MATSCFSLPRLLDGGLVLRQATPEDAEALSAFNARIHSDLGPDYPDLRVQAWTHDLLTRPHPTFSPGDFTLVTEGDGGRIVSSMNLISQAWSYGGIPFKVGRPELVGTLPEYRNRGLVRLQFDLVHHWSAQRGELVQAITGIPYYYRLFGYEMALNLGGSRLGYKPQVPQLKDGQAEPYRLRPAAPADLPLIAALYERANHRYPLACLRDEAMWRYELDGKSELNVSRYPLLVIETPSGEALGYLATTAQLWYGKIFPALAYELKPGLSYAAVTPSVVRYLYQAGLALAAQAGKADEFESFAFSLGESHPAYDALHGRLPGERRRYAYYLRVPDLPAFIRHIRPALEQRLETSACAGHTGQVKITFYRGGLLLGFNGGRLEQVEAYRPTPVGHSGDVGFPGLTFLQLLFNYRSLDELMYAFPDCWCENEFYPLLNALFPRQPSDLWPVG